MSKTAQVFSLFFSVLVSYLWIQVPEINKYALQFTSLLVLTYAGIKLFFLKTTSQRFQQSYARVFPVLSYELLIFCSALLLLVGHTGGVRSLFLPLLYFLLFLSVFMLEFIPLILLSFLVPTFLWAILKTLITTHELATLLSFPLLLPLLLFAKVSYEEHKQEKRIVQCLEDQEHDVLMFLTTFLQPKLINLLKLSEYAEHNKEGLQKQLHLLIEESTQFTQETDDTLSKIPDHQDLELKD